MEIVCVCVGYHVDFYFRLEFVMTLPLACLTTADTCTAGGPLQGRAASARLPRGAPREAVRDLGKGQRPVCLCRPLMTSITLLASPLDPSESLCMGSCRCVRRSCFNGMYDFFGKEYLCNVGSHGELPLKKLILIYLTIYIPFELITFE